MAFLRRRRRPPSDLREVLDGQLLVPTPDTGEQKSGYRVLEKDEEIPLVLVSDDEGMTVLPAFTSEETLRRWTNEPTTFVGLPASVLVEMLAESDWDRMVIDGAGPHPFAVSRSEAQELAGLATYSVAGGSTMFIGEPATAPPNGMREALHRACEREPLVRAAYLFQMALVERDEVPHLAVGLHLDEGEDVDVPGVARRIGDAMDPQRWGYDFVDFHVLSEEMLETVSSAVSAVYRRSEAAG